MLLNTVRGVYDEVKQLRVNIHDFSVRDVIGEGFFGTVHLVVENSTSDVYAMKIIKKSMVTTSQAKEERDIMSRRSSEWLTNLHYAFQVSNNKCRTLANRSMMFQCQINNNNNCAV